MAEIRIAVRVRPGSSRTRVGGAYGPDRALVVAVNAPPVDGAANTAVIGAVAQALRVRRWQLTVGSGESSRSKVLRLIVADADAALMAGRIEGLLAGLPAED